MKRIVLVVFAIGLLFLASMLRATDGRPALPLDDSYIYFQYAKQAALGHPFVYQSGDLATTGCTSVPWMLALAAGALVGFSGKSIIFFAMVMAGLLLAVAAHLAGQAERRIGGDVSSRGWPFAAVLVVLAGPLHWGAWSGMEIAAFTAAIVWAFAAWSDERPSGISRAAALTVLALVRPEGAVLALCALLAWGVNALGHAEDRRRLPWAAIPALALFAQPLLNWILTGDWRSSGYLAKSLMAAPGAEFVDVLRIALLRAASLGAALFGHVAPFADGRGLYAYESEAAWMFVAPGAAALFLIGVLPEVAREMRDRRVGAGGLGLGWIVALLVVTCTLQEPDAHFSRYQMPILPVFLVFVALGIRRIGLAFANAHFGWQSLAHGLRIWCVGFGIVSIVFFAGAYGDDCEDIDRMQVALGEMLAKTLQPQEVVALNDAGALAYFSNQHMIDLVGLTTPGFAGLWQEGSAPIWEALEALPVAQRPAWFCIFPNWFEFDGIGLLRRKGGVRLLSPSIVDAEKVLYRADWSSAESGHRPYLQPDDAERIRVVDRIDVAERASEATHDLRFSSGQHGAAGGTFLQRMRIGENGPEIVDGGRTILREVVFSMTPDPSRAGALVVRTVSGARQRVLVSVDGSPEVEVELYARGGGRFHEQSVATIEPGAESARVRIRVVPEVAGTAPLILAHLFLLAGLP